MGFSAPIQSPFNAARGVALSVTKVATEARFVVNCCPSRRERLISATAFASEFCASKTKRLLPSEIRIINQFMSVRKNPLELGPDLLARYLGEYVQSRQMSDMERGWGFGDDGLDAVFTRLTSALNSDPKRLNAILAAELSDSERAHVIESLAPFIFALPLRTYPAELRASVEGERFVFVLLHAAEIDAIGYLPAALAGAFVSYVRRIFTFRTKQRRKESIISSLGRRRQVSIALLADEAGATIRFLGRLPSHGEEP